MRGLMMAVALMLPATALAQAAPEGQARSDKNAPPPPGQPHFTLVAEPVAMMIATFDDDHDGKVTRDELRKGVERSFFAIDTAHSGSMGYIGFADWAKLWLGDATALPSPFEVDANGDNRITLDELQATFARTFARFDKDKDGVLTRAELLTIRADAGRSFGTDDRRGRKGRAP